MTELSLLVKNERAWRHAAFLQSRCYLALVVAAAVNSSPPSKSQHPAPASGEKYLDRLEGWLPSEENRQESQARSTRSHSFGFSRFIRHTAVLLIRPTDKEGRRVFVVVLTSEESMRRLVSSNT